MNIISWNIQVGKGVDGKVDLARICDTLKAIRFPDGQAADLICLQEVARHFSALVHPEQPDQAQYLAAAWPDFYPVFRAAVDVVGEPHSTSLRRQFGCMVLSRFPILQVFNHMLTQQGAAVKAMQRQVLEVVVQTPSAVRRVMTTHLEYHAQPNRVAQLAHIHTIRTQYTSEPSQPIPASQLSEPYSAYERPVATILCGDLNFTPDAPEYSQMLMEYGWEDVWQLTAQDAPYPPSCGLDNSGQWPQGPHCRDYFFVSSDLAKHVLAAGIDTQTRASDHQPIFLSLSP